MKIGFYNPYFDGLGGGERYTLTLASHWSHNHTVEVFCDDSSMLDKAEKRFGLDLSHVRIVPNIFRSSNIIKKLFATRAYDCIFFLTDGSVPTSLSKHTILHIQVPIRHMVINSFMLHRIDAIVCNSKFTKKYVDPRVGDKATVIYPPVRSIASMGEEKKEHMILSVGRFSSVHSAKKQEIMIDAFIQLEARIPKWKLVLAGGLLSSDMDYFLALKKKAQGHRIEILDNIAYTKLLDLYRSASIYWHAAGYNETDPVYAEHFGITTIEAANAGAVPVVYAGGGQQEIIHDEVDGMLWTTQSELIEKTNTLISKPAFCMTLRAHAKSLWKHYSEKSFLEQYDSLLMSIT